MQLFVYVVSKFLDYTTTNFWSLHVIKTFNSQIRNYQYAEQNSKMCLSSLICRWLQSEKPWWSLSRHDGQVSCCMRLRQAVHTHCILQILEDCRTVSIFWPYNKGNVTEMLQNKLFFFAFSPYKRDIGKVVEVLYGDNPPPIMIIGHSMGGAIAVHTAAANHIPSLLGLCVIDVVEGKSFPI